MVEVNRDNYNCGRIFTDIEHKEYEGLSSSPDPYLSQMQQTYKVTIEHGMIVAKGSWKLEPISDKNIKYVLEFYKGLSLEQVLKYIERY